MLFHCQQLLSVRFDRNKKSYAGYQRRDAARMCDWAVSEHVVQQQSEYFGHPCFSQYIDFHIELCQLQYEVSVIFEQ